MEEAQGLPNDELDLLNGRVNAAGGAKVVAVDAGLSGPHLYRVLNGDRPLTAKTLYKLRSPLKLTQAEYDWLLMSARPGGRNVRPKAERASVRELGDAVIKATEALIQRVDSGDAMTFAQVERWLSTHKLLPAERVKLATLLVGG